MSEALDANWSFVCKTADVDHELPLRVELPNLPPLAVFKVDEDFFVTNDTCTHGEASLCDGFVDGDQIECPWHSGRFCIRDGKATAYPAVEPIRVYPVKVFNDDVCIDMTAATQLTQGRAEP